MIDSEQIEDKMKELAKQLDYDFRNIKWLRKAMYCKKRIRGNIIICLCRL